MTIGRRKDANIGERSPGKGANVDDGSLPDSRKWDDISDSDLRGALAAVKYGHDPVAARNLIEYFHERMRDCRPLNDLILREYIEHAFARIIEDEKSADVAFGLRLARGEFPRPNTMIRDVQAAAYITILMRKGWTWLEAVGEAANLLFPDGKGDKAVQQAYAEHRDYLGNLRNEYLIGLLPEGAPVISRDKNG